jgi:hypothetical protein
MPPLTPQLCPGFSPELAGHVGHGLILISQDTRHEAWCGKLTQADEGMVGGELSLRGAEPRRRRMGRL